MNGASKFVLAAAASGWSVTASTAMPPAGAKLETIAEWLAAEACPDFLTGDLVLANNAELKSLRFSEVIEKRESARFGTMGLLSATFADGGIAFGGVIDKVCTVVVTGPASAAALPKLRQAKEALGIKFERQPDTRVAAGMLAVETYKAQVNAKTALYVQVVDGLKAPQPLVTYQLMGMVN